MPCHDQADVEAPGLEAGRPKVYLEPQQRSRPAAPHQGIVWPRIPQIIAPPPHLQRSPARPVFQYLGSCQPALLPSANLAFQLCFNFQTCVSSLCSNCVLNLCFQLVFQLYSSAFSVFTLDHTLSVPQYCGSENLGTSKCSINVQGTQIQQH